MQSDPVARVSEFHVGPDVTLRLDGAGKVESMLVRSGRRPQRTEVLRVPGAGKPLPFPTNYTGGSHLRTWDDAEGRVAAAQIA